MRTALLYFPFVVFVILLPVNSLGHWIIYPTLGIEENTGVFISVAMIALGLLLGLTGVVFSRQMRWYWRILVATLYIPTIGASLIISGL